MPSSPCLACQMDFSVGTGLDSALARLAWMAVGTRHRQTRDGHRLAPSDPSAVLEVAEPSSSGAADLTTRRPHTDFAPCRTRTRSGARRIDGELLKLGIHVCQVTVAEYMGSPAAITIADLAGVLDESRRTNSGRRSSRQPLRRSAGDAQRVVDGLQSVAHYEAAAEFWSQDVRARRRPAPPRNPRRWKPSFARFGITVVRSRCPLRVRSPHSSSRAARAVSGDATQLAEVVSRNRAHTIDHSPTRIPGIRLVSCTRSGHGPFSGREEIKAGTIIRTFSDDPAPRPLRPLRDCVPPRCRRDGRGL